MNREAAARIKRVLGMDLETAQSRLQSVTALEAAANDGSESARQMQVQVEQLTRERDEAVARAEAAEARVAKIKRRSSEQNVAARVQAAAARAGLLPNEEGYAVHEFRQVVRQAIQAKQPVPNPSEFFAALKEKKPYLFADGAPAAPPPTARPSTAGPDSPPGQEPPSPAPAGSPPPARTADQMDDQEFKNHTRANYGFMGV